MYAIEYQQRKIKEYIMYELVGMLPIDKIIGTLQVSCNEKKYAN